MPDAYQKKLPLPTPPVGGYDKTHNYRPGLRLRTIKLEREKNRLLNILHRDVEKLLVQTASTKRMLDKDEVNAVATYLKLVRDIQKAEREEEANMTPEQLAAIAGE